VRILLAALGLCALLVTGGGQAAASDPPALVEVPVRFDIANADVIPLVASVHASCEILASGEALALRNDESVRTTIGVRPGVCSIVLTLFGAEVPLPILNATPLGRDAFYIPGVATVTLGLVDVSVDLQTELHASLEVRDPLAATLAPSNLSWTAWGAARVVVDAVDGEGSVLETTIATSFRYAMSVGITAYALSVPAYHQDLVQIGEFPGSVGLETALAVDVRPPALTLLPPTDVTSDAATFAWTGEVPEDADRLELWLSEPQHVVAYPIQDTGTTWLRVSLRPSTSHEAWIVTVDGAGQSTVSNVVAFASPSDSEANAPLEPSAIPSLPWAILAVGALVAVVVAAGLRARKSS
jgi:hypothetical protein